MEQKGCGLGDLYGELGSDPERGAEGRGGVTWRSGVCLPDSSNIKGPVVGSVACRTKLLGRAQNGRGALPDGTDLLFLFFFLLGKTCFPACQHPVESWSPATSVKDLEAGLSEVLKPKHTLFMKL